MNDLQKAGGLSAILFGTLFLIALVLITPPFASMPPDALEATNSQGRLAYIAALPQAQFTILTIGFGLEILAPLFMFPALAALYTKFKDTHYSHAVLASGIGALGIPFLIISHLPRFSLLDLARRYAVAAEAGRTALGAAYAYAEGLSLIAETVFWLFMGTALLVYAYAMWRAAFPRWLAIFSCVLAIVALLSAIVSVAWPDLGFLSLIALVLLIAWSLGTGITLFRSAPSATRFVG